MVLGFGLAAVVGVPVGVLCGCFHRIGAFFAPLTIVGRNIPIAALIPLTFSLFGIGEFQKMMFIFIACVAFVVSDTATAIGEISSRYVDTAYTLGASRRQIILKVLVPLAMPSVFNSLRLLFGLAFGYIMLAELVKFGGESGGLGDIINTSRQTRHPNGHPAGPDDHPVGRLGDRPVPVLGPAATVPLPLWQRRPAAPGPGRRCCGPGRISGACSSTARPAEGAGRGGRSQVRSNP